jgi:hypothetical protein
MGHANAMNQAVTRRRNDDPPDRITTMRDAKLVAGALERAEPGSARHEFILRLRRSFHQFGSLTTAMREALVSDNAEMRGRANRRRGR